MQKASMVDVLVVIYMKWTSGPIIIYAGQLYRRCNQNWEIMKPVLTKVYLHELAHALGLGEWEVEIRGLSFNPKAEVIL